MELAIIQNRIYDIRGQKVMIDRDLAGLYQVETRRLNEAVKRNIKRFPSDFMFQLTKEEFESLMSQFATSNRGGTRKLPFAFTEQGLAMLSGVLNSDVAIEVNISIMRAFVAIRRTMVMSPDNDIKRLQNEMKELKEYIEDVFTDYNDINDDTRVQLELVNQAIAQLQGRGRFPETHKPVGYDVILKEIEKSK